MKGSRVASVLACIVVFCASAGVAQVSCDCGYVPPEDVVDALRFVVAHPLEIAQEIGGASLSDDSVLLGRDVILAAAKLLGKLEIHDPWELLVVIPPLYRYPWPPLPYPPPPPPPDGPWVSIEDIVDVAVAEALASANNLAEFHGELLDARRTLFAQRHEWSARQAWKCLVFLDTVVQELAESELAGIGCQALGLCGCSGSAAGCAHPTQMSLLSLFGDAFRGSLINGADLVVTEVVSTGAPTIVDGSATVPVRVTVKNIGSVGAGRFKVSMQFRDPSDPLWSQTWYAVAFTVPGQGLWFPFAENGLGAGNQVSFEGVLTFHPAEKSGQREIRAIVDSCCGEEFVPAYCRVLELSEANNTSGAVTITLP